MYRLPAVLLLGALGCASGLPDQPDSLPLDEVYRVEISGTLVGVELWGADQLTVDTSLRWKGKRNEPELLNEVIDGVLHVEGACPDDADLCEVIHILEVPSDIQLDLQLDRVDLIATGTARLDVFMTGGSARLHELHGETNLRANGTDVDGTALAAEQLFVSTNGTIDLDFATAPTQLSASSEQSVLVRAPGGAYRLDLASQHGRVITDGIFHTDESPHALQLRSTVGTVMVLANDR